jgi:hypothetical protein
MPLIVKDSDVLQQIALNDAQVAKIQAQIVALGSSVPPTTLAAWRADMLTWAQWSTAATARLSGGFLFGEWDTTADGNAVIAWKLKFDGYQAVLNIVAKGGTPPVPVPPDPSSAQVADANNAAVIKQATGGISDAAAGVEGVVKWAAIGLVAVAAVAVLRK